MSKQITQNQWLPSIVSIAVGACVWFMFESIISTSGVTGGFTYWWAGYAVMFLAAGLLGYLFNQRPWRWGIYIVIAHVVMASIRSKGDHSMLPLELIFYALLALLFVLASYLGAWLSRKLGQQT